MSLTADLLEDAQQENPETAGVVSLLPSREESLEPFPDGSLGSMNNSKGRTVFLVLVVVGVLLLCGVFLITLIIVLAVTLSPRSSPPPPAGVYIPSVDPSEDSFSFAARSQYTVQQVIGAANEFKEGDDAINLAAADVTSRSNARALLRRTTIQSLHEKPLYEDNIQALIWSEVDAGIYATIKEWTLNDLVEHLVSSSESQIKSILPGLNSHVIGSVVKILTNEQLGLISKKINTNDPLHPHTFGETGVLGARIQPNSPTDDSADVLLQVLDGFSYGVGDVVIGINPVDVTIENVLRLELLLKEIVENFGIGSILPWCVLADVETQYQVEQQQPNSTVIWFQSLAGVDSALETFGFDVNSMLFYANERKKINNGYSFYFETGQGADYKRSRSWL